MTDLQEKNKPFNAGVTVRSVGSVEFRASADILHLTGLHLVEELEYVVARNLTT
jgi:hypothetical protein